LNQQHGSEVPLILMNSFNTNQDTKKIIQKYANHDLNILTFDQSRFPRFGKETMSPLPTKYNDPNYKWSPFYPL